MKSILLLAALASAALFSGCATIVKDDSQPVAFSSEPQGATVRINGVAAGQTPATIMVKHAFKRQMVQLELEGYQPETFRLEETLAGMTLGNVIFGGVIGVGVDLATGKATNYPESVHVKLQPLGAAAATGPSTTQVSKPGF